MKAQNNLPFFLLTAILAMSGSYAFAGTGNPGTNNGNNDKNTETTTETKTVTAPFNVSGSGWVIIEVIDDKTPQPQPEGKVVVERKNISQVPVTKIEVHSCQKNVTPDALVPILREINQSVNHRRIYVQEVNGKTTYYISPEVKENAPAPAPAGSTPAPAPGELTVPFIFQIKI
jgi:hypothetical protein